MLQLTDTAADVLEQARSAEDIPDSYGIRVSVVQTQDEQPSLALGFVEGPNEGDEVLERDGIELYVAEEVAGPLAGSVIDAEATPEGAQLVVKPQES